MKNRVGIAVLLLFVVLSGRAATIVSVSTGNWANATTWSPSQVPTCGDSVIISIGHTVTINSQQSYLGCSSRIIVVIRGTLYFQSGNKLRLPCNSKIYIFINGALDSDGSGNSNQLELCGNSEWKGTDGRISGPTCIPASLPGCNSVLPVDLVNFSGFTCAGSLCFSWATMAENNNGHFELQRSTDGLNFVTVAIVPTLANGGYSNRALLYGAVDSEPLNNLAYYRLTQIDLDGKAEFSAILVIGGNQLKRPGFSIFPNPAESAFNVSLDAVQPGSEARVYVLGTLGQIIYSNIFYPETHSFVVKPELAIPPGFYVVKLTVVGHESAIKLIVR
jgi:hypothetical protein